MFNPSTADSTEIAGVIAPSPYVSAAPRSPTATMTGRGDLAPVWRSTYNETASWG